MFNGGKAGHQQPAPAQRQPCNCTDNARSCSNAHVTCAFESTCHMYLSVNQSWVSILCSGRTTRLPRHDVQYFASQRWPQGCWHQGPLQSVASSSELECAPVKVDDHARLFLTVPDNHYAFDGRFEGCLGCRAMGVAGAAPRQGWSDAQRKKYIHT
jgi:hypothetical protein